jgi:hypothetical protein
MVWREEQKKDLKKKKNRALKSASALGLPDVMKPFFLFVHKTWGRAVGVNPAARFLAPPGSLFIKAKIHSPSFPLPLFS